MSSSPLRVLLSTCTQRGYMGEKIAGEKDFVSCIGSRIEREVDSLAMDKVEVNKHSISLHVK